MSWNWVIRRLDVAGVIPSPILIAVVLILAAGVAWQERRVLRESHAVTHITITSDQENISEVDNEFAAPGLIREGVTAMLAAQGHAAIDPAAVQAAPVYRNLDAVGRVDFLVLLGEQLVNQHRYREAIAVFEVVDSQERVSRGAAFAYGMALSRQGRDEEALAAYGRHHQAFPSHQAGAINYGLLLVRFGENEQAIRVLSTAADISSGERRGKALSVLGGVLLAAGRYDEAAQALQSSINYRPGSSSTWRKYAQALSLRGAEEEEVVSGYASAFALDPSRHEALHEWANYLLSRGRFFDAISRYAEANKLAEDRFDLQIDRAINLHVSGRPSAARRILRALERQRLSRHQQHMVSLLEAVTKGSEDGIRSRWDKRPAAGEPDEREKCVSVFAMAALGDLAGAQALADKAEPHSVYRLAMQFEIAKAFLQRNEAQAAEEILAGLSADAKDSSLIWYEYARALAARGKSEGRLYALEQAFSLEPQSKKITLAYAQEQLRTGHSEKASAALEQLLERYPNYGKALLLMADVYEAGSNDAAASRVLSRLIQLEPDDKAVVLRLARTLIRAGEKRRALAVIDELVEQDTGLVEVRLLRLEVLLALGEVAAAREESDLILRLDPENEAAAEVLSKYPADGQVYTSPE